MCNTFLCASQFNLCFLFISICVILFPNKTYKIFLLWGFLFLKRILKLCKANYIAPVYKVSVSDPINSPVELYN